MEIRIALNNLPDASEGDKTDGDRCGYLPSRHVAVLGDMRDTMPNRDANVYLDGVDLQGSIISWGLEYNDVILRPELVIKINESV